MRLAVIALCCFACSCTWLSGGRKAEIRKWANEEAVKVVDSAEKDLLWELVWKFGGGGAVGLLLTVLGLREAHHKAVGKLNGKTKETE